MNEYTGDFYFKRSNGERVLLAENVNEDEAWTVMKKFLDDHRYKSYYTRRWETPDGEVWFDCGSYTEFFVMVIKHDDKRGGDDCNTN